MLETLIEEEINAVIGGGTNCACCNSTEIKNIFKEVYKEIEINKNEFELTEWGMVWMGTKVFVIASFITIASMTICCPSIASMILPSKTLATMKLANKIKQQ